ncbi:MAG: pyocin knob domain-containing protein [Gammaproteobacteria bacterium]|nr:pyocin knob domain-containing protein [Gammaproteobacteria bacterium]
MQRVDTTTAIGALPSDEPGGTPGFFTKGDPGQGVNATIPGQDWYNSIQEELAYIVESQGGVLDKAKKTQLYTYILNLIVNSTHMAQQFLAHEAVVPDMTVVVDAGVVGINTGSGRVYKSQQASGTITAPTTNPRRDLIEINGITGTLNIVTGTEAGSPSAPNVTPGSIVVGYITLTVGMTEISNQNITDLRAAINNDAHTVRGMPIEEIQNNFSPPAATDLNTLKQSGFYRLESGNTNAPSATDYGQLIVCHGGGDTILQIVTDFGGGDSSEIYFRNGNPSDVGGSGDWSPWHKIHHNDNAMVCNVAAPATPLANTIYKDNIVKSKCSIYTPSGTPTIVEDFNVSSLTDIGVGQIQINFATLLPSANYSVSGIGNTTAPYRTAFNNETLAYVRVYLYNDSDALVDAASTWTIV